VCVPVCALLLSHKFVIMTTPAPTTAPAAAAAAPAPATPSAVVFIGKIPSTCTKADITQFLEPAGKVKRVVVKKPRRVDTVLFAFAEFEDAASAPKVIETLNGKELGGAAIVVEAARNQFPKKRARFQRKRKAPAAPAAGAPAGAAPAGTTAAPAAGEKKGRRPRRFGRRPRRQYVDAPISKDVAYVGNLPYIVDEEHMKDIFEGCKFIEARVVRRARDNRSKGFGFVTFANEEDRANAIKVADGSVVEGRKIHVSPARERVERPKTEEAAAPATTSN